MIKLKTLSSAIVTAIAAGFLFASVLISTAEDTAPQNNEQSGTPIYRTSDYLKMVADGKKDNEIPENLRRRVKNIRDLVEKINVKQNSDCDNHIGKKAVQALALMQALPYLTNSSYPNDNNEVKNKNAESFKNAKNGAGTNLSSVCEKYFIPAQKKDENNDAYKNRIKPYSEKTIADVGYGNDGTNRVYDVSLALMCLEYYYSGGLNIEFNQVNKKDRSITVNMVPPKDVQLAIARLTTILLCSNCTQSGKKYFEPLNKGYLWDYTTFGTENTCAHKSSFAMMGIRAAVNMGIFDFDDAAFSFKFKKDDATTVGKKNFLLRLQDVMIHSVLTTFDLKAFDKSSSAMGVIVVDEEKKFEDFIKECFQKDAKKDEAHVAKGDISETKSVADAYKQYYQPKQGKKGLVFNGEVGTTTDITGWQQSYFYEKQWMTKTTGDKTSLFTQPEAKYYVLYSYRIIHPEDTIGVAYGAYHTTCGAYVLATAANMLPLIQEAVKKRDEPCSYSPQYPVIKESDGKIKIDGKTFTYKDDIPYCSLMIDGTPVALRIVQALNYVVRMTTTNPVLGKVKVKMPFYKKEKKEKFAAWLYAISFINDFRLPLNFYGYLKLGMAIGEPDYFGPWNYYDDMCEFLCDSVEQKNDRHVLKNEHIDKEVFREFTILFLTSTFRPLYGQESTATTTSTSK